jgi:iron complex outermembrane receptor protein
MQKKILLSMVTVVYLQAVDLGSISVESSTIDEKVDTQKAEVSTVQTITSEDIKRINPKSISDILNTVPGVTMSLVGTDSLKVHIRGIDNQMYMGEKPGVAIVVDGVPVQETTGKINIDLDNIESIKVIKGGASFLYGNDALSGAVIITTKRQKGDKSDTKITFEGGSFGYKKVVVSTNQAFDTGALQLQGSYSNTDGYWNDTFVKVKSINGKYQYYLNDVSDIIFGWDFTKRETGDGNSVKGITEATLNPKSEDYYSYAGYYDSDLSKLFVTYNQDLSDDSNFMVRVHSYQDDKSYKSARFTKDNSEIWNQIGAKAEYRTKVGSFALMGGFDIQKNSTDEESITLVDVSSRGKVVNSVGDLIAKYETEESVNAIYAELKHQTTDSLATTFNIRHDSIKHEYKDNMDNSNNVDPSYNSISYRLGFNYLLDNSTSLYTSFSTGFRTPTVGQISQNQVSLVNDPTLDIPSIIDVETTYNYELGLKGKLPYDISYNSSIFQLDRNDYIGKIAGSYVTSDDEDESNYDNVGDMRSRGFELALNSNRSKMFSLDLAYTYLQARFKNYSIMQQITEDTDPSWSVNNATFQRKDLSGNYVPRSPKHTVNLSLNYKPTTDLTISPEIYYKGSYYADEVNNFKQKGYEVVTIP